MSVPSTSAHHRVSPTYAACFVVAAFFGFTAASAQQQQTATDTQQQETAADLNSLEEWKSITEPLLASIEQEEKRNGLSSPNLIDPLTRLGIAYQRYDEHLLAVTVLERALYLKRVNEGLHGLDQAELVERILDSERAIGRVGAVEDLEEQLLELARRNAENPAAAPIFRDAAERRLDHFEAYLRHDVPPELSVFQIESWKEASFVSLGQARLHYYEAIHALSANLGEHQAEIDELEERITRTYYLEARDRGRSHQWPDRFYQGPDDPLYYLGFVNYRREAEDALRFGSTTVDYAETLVELADWSLLFSRNGTAVERYAEAYELLVEQRAPAAAVEQIFPRDVPVFLPVFESPLTEAVSPGSNGYVDVDFEVSKYGQPRKVTIVAVAGDDAVPASEFLSSAINEARFRPSPTEGKTEYRLRYSLADGSLTPRR